MYRIYVTDVEIYSSKNEEVGCIVIIVYNIVGKCEIN